MVRFTPKLDILPPPQRTLWDELDATPEDFTLYGGTAIALQLGHRQSVDFDFFGCESFDSAGLRRSVPYLKEGVVTQEAPNTLTVRVNRGGDVYISYFGVPKLGEIKPPSVADNNGLKIASLIDLAALKTVAICSRVEKKDYLDIDALLQNGIDLGEALSAAEIVQGPSFNRFVGMKALSYFEDEGLSGLPLDVKSRLLDEVRRIDPAEQKQIAYNRRYGEARKK